MTSFNPHQIPEIAAVDAESASSGRVLLDVREPEEWTAGHAPGAFWIPLGELERARTELPFNRQIVCVCRTGGRSARATEALLECGF